MLLPQSSKAPALQAQSPRTARGQIQIMGNHDRSEPVCSVQPLQQVKDFAGSGFVKVAGRFVGQKQPRIADQGARQRYALLFAAGKLARPMLGSILQVNLLEPFRCRRKSIASTISAS